MSNVFVFRQLPPGVINEYFGGGGKGGTTTSKVEIPPEVLARYNAVNARAETAAQQPYQAYSQDPNAFVQPLTGTQQAGIQNTNTMAGAAQPYYGAATGLAAAGTQNVNPGALNVGQYYNPFTQAVAAPTLQALQQQQATERSSLVNPQTAASFGGDRSGVVAANLARQQALGTAQAMAPIYQGGYNQAMTTAQQQQGVGLGAAQANRQNAQTSAQLFGQLGTGAQAAGLAGAQAQMGAGQVEQQTGQAGLQALYNQFQQQQGYPFQVAQFLSNIAEGTGALSGNTTTTQQPGGFFSDERLKENIQRVGETNDGQPIYRYNYKGDPRTQIGLIAQEVEKGHPDAVGSSHGYKTVDYKKATDDAVHKADGGEVTDAPSGLAAYGMDAPSAMLSKPMVGRDVAAGLAPGPMMTGNIPIHPGAVNPEAAGILAPKATGVSPGSIEGAQAQLASLQGGKEPWSGQGYKDWQTNQLQDFLAKNSSQGGLVGSQGGEFSRGGFADGGYMNPALQYYGPGKGDMMGAGPYGVAPRQGQNRGLLQGTKPPAAGPSGVSQAKEMAGLALQGNEMFKARPDFLRSAADVAARERTALANRADEEYRIQRAGLGAAPNQTTTTTTGPGVKVSNLDEAPLPVARPTSFAMDDSELPAFAARGGLIEHRDHYAGLGYVNPGSGPYATGDDNSLASILSAPQEHHEMLKGGTLPQQKQPSGAQDLAKGLGQAQAAKKAGTYAADKLDLGAGEKALGSAVGDSVGTGAAVNAATAPTAGVIDLTTAAAPEAAAGLAGAGEAAGLGAAAAEGAGLAGTVGTGLAAAGSTAAEVLPFILPFLSDKRAKHDIEKVGELDDGQPVYRYKYNGDDRTQMGLLAQNVERDGHKDAVTTGLGGMKMVDYKKATNDAVHKADGGPLSPKATAPDQYGGTEMTPEDQAALKALALKTVVEKTDAPPAIAAKAAEVAAKPKEERAVVARPVIDPDRSPYQYAASKVLPEGMGEAAKSALTSENFWVPALSGIGSMLASKSPNLGGALGEGLVGATTAYTGLQKQQSETDKRAMDTEKVRSEITGGSFITDSQGRQVIRYLMPNGQYGIMRPSEYWALPKDQRPRLDPGSERQLSEMESQLPGGTSAATKTVSTEGNPPAADAAAPAADGKLTSRAVEPEAGRAPSTTPPPNEEVVTAPAIKVPEELKKSAVTKAQQLYDAEAGATAAYPDVVKPAVDAAASAQNQRPPLLSLANSLAGQPRGSNVLTPGAVQQIAQPVMAVANNLASIFGIPTPSLEADMSNTEVIKKNLKMLAKEAQGNSIAHAAFLDMEQAIPTNLNSSDAQAKMLADILAINQRIIDRGGFHGQLRDAASGPDGMFIGKAPHAASALNPDAAFNKAYSPAFYAEEKKALIKAFKDGPDVKNSAGRQMSWYEFLHEHGSKLSQKQKNEITKQLGSPNILRYFGLGE